MLLVDRWIVNKTTTCVGIPVYTFSTAGSDCENGGDYYIAGFFQNKKILLKKPNLNFEGFNFKE